MTNWTPSTIYQKANAIADIAKQIDAQLWYGERHGVHQTEAYNRDLEDKQKRLQEYINEFRKMDTDGMIAELREVLR